MYQIQEKTEFRFLLEKSTNTTTKMLDKILGYLSDAEVTEALITITMEIPNNMDGVMTLILDNTSPFEVKLVVANRDQVTVMSNYVTLGTTRRPIP